MFRLAFCAAFAAVTTTAAHAVPISLDLDFATPTAESVPTFNSDVDGDDTIEFGVVANDGSSDIYAALKRISGDHLKGSNPTKVGQNGSRVDANFGDVGLIHGKVGTSAVYELTLYSDTYVTQYTNSNGFDWSVTFLDIDGAHASQAPNYYDELVLYTPGTATVAVNTALNQSINGAGNLVFDGKDAGEVGGTATSGLAGDAFKAAVGYTVTDTAQMAFGWNIQLPGQDRQIDRQNRTLFFSGDLLFDEDDDTTQVDVPLPPVPLPASALLLLAGVGGLAGLRRFSKA